MTNSFRSAVIYAMVSLLASGCYYDVEEELYPSLECQTDQVSYQTTVVPILSNNCLGCHSVAANFGNVMLEGYSNVKTYVDNGKLLGAIKHQSGFSAMPQNQPQLITCDIAKIEKWIQNGALND